MSFPFPTSKCIQRETNGKMHLFSTFARFSGKGKSQEQHPSGDCIAEIGKGTGPAGGGRRCVYVWSHARAWQTPVGRLAALGMPSANATCGPVPHDATSPQSTDEPEMSS
uniref:Uncharacterized protein n=1 Tax=Eutreptiella gymnastica TaxID=73025 RepID=A0A7S4CUB0_9EUGL